MMAARTMPRRRDDDGFTVIEVVVAAAILFFVLTAIVGLLGASSSMTVQAKQRAVMTNAVASYLDGLRVRPWDEIVQPDGPIVMVVNGITVTINVSVETRSAEDGQELAKIVRVRAVSTLNGKSQMYETSISILRNPNFARSLQTDPDAPVVFFTADAPPDESVIWEDQWSGGALILRTKTFSPNDKIKSVRYDVTGMPNGDPLAIYTPDPMVQTYYAAPLLNTVSAGLDDGFQTVSVTAIDDHERVGTQKRRFIVDNLAPQSPGSSTITSLTATDLEIAWPAARDGGTYDAPNYASHYECEVSVEPSQTQPSTAVNRVILNEGPLLAGSNVVRAVSNAGPIVYEAAVASATAPVWERAVGPFSRFWARVRAYSPRGLTNGQWVQCSVPGYTRPELFCESAPSPYHSSCTVRTWGSGADKGTEYELDLFVSRAGFKRASDSPQWRIEYQSALTTPTPTGWQELPVVPSASVYDSWAMRLYAKYKFTGFTDGRPMYFRVRVSGYVALRNPSGPVPTMWTNAAGPTEWGTAEGKLTYLTPDWSF